MKRQLLCYIHGKDDQWEAFCVDLDLAVAARTPRQARELLEGAIKLYFESALAAAPADRARLLSRQAPLWFRFKLAFQAAIFAFRSRSTGRGEEQFIVSCPA